MALGNPLRRTPVPLPRETTYGTSTSKSRIIGLGRSLAPFQVTGLPSLEVDANPNPLREDVLRFAIVDGWVTLSDAPGLGLEPDLSPLTKYLALR
jgi:hypothetical protein